MKSTYCEYILEKILSTSEVGPILSLIAPSPLINSKSSNRIFICSQHLSLLNKIDVL
jgi:hypothetical protein